jgi:DNA-binding NarL/FixJ family response regulator
MLNKVENSYCENILIVDDHPLTVEVHKGIISKALKEKKINYLTATTAQNAYELISEICENGEALKMVLFDINLPPYKEKNIESGEDLAIVTRKWFPKCKIVIISMHSDPLWVNRIIKAINPEGFLAKSDVDAKSLAEICSKIEADFFYYSDSIKKSNKIIIQQNIDWDEYDTKILQFLAEGYKTSQLTKFIPLSLSAIEKRKANIKKQLIFETGYDKELIEIAKSKGLL